MDENNNGPVPGIIGQNVPSEPAVTELAPAEPKDNGKVFDSSEFTGATPESLSFDANGDEKNAEKKPKGSNPFTKWQLWAITSGVLLVAGIAGVFVTASIYEGKLKGSNSISSYDSLSSSIDTNKKDFEEKLVEYTKVVYSSNASNSTLTINPAYSTNPEYYLYPTEDDIYVAGNDCLKQDIYGLTDEDLNYVETRKTGLQLQNEGKDVAKEAERLEKINNAYYNAAQAIDTCHDPLINIKLKDFKVELSDAEYTEDGSKVDIRRSIKVTYTGSKELKNFAIIYGMKDKNGLVAEFQYMTHSAKNAPIKKGDVFESRVCGYTFSYSTSTDNCVYTTSAEEAKKIKALKPELMSISGQYASSYDFKK